MLKSSRFGSNAPFSGAARSLSEGKPASVLGKFASKAASIISENEFGVSSARFPSSALNSGVARIRWVDEIPSLCRTDNDIGPLSEIDSMECFVYILGSSGKDGYRTYVGWTSDLDRRLAQHNAGTGARSTRGRVWVVLYAEQHATRREAMSREWHLKRDRRLRKQLARNG